MKQVSGEGSVCTPNPKAPHGPHPNPQDIDRAASGTRTPDTPGLILETLIPDIRGPEPYERYRPRVQRYPTF